MADRIKGITVEINGDTTKLTKALSDTNKSIRETQTQLKDVEKLLKLDPTNITLLKQKQEMLTKAIADTKSKLDTLKTAQKQMDASGVDKNSDQYRALQREIIETEQKLKDLENTARESNATIAQIGAVGEKLKDVGGKITEVGKDLTTKVTLPLAAVGAMGAKSFAEVDKTMQLTNKTMGNTAEEAELLNAAMKEAAANSVYGMSDAATATLNFARAGLDAEQAAAALAPAMNLAAGEGENLDTVSAGLVATINGFHGSFEEASVYADVFAAACNNSALDVDSLSNAMSVAAPIFSAAGYSVSDAALYLGVMANSGIEANKAANSLKTGLARLVAPAKDGAEMMATLGISVTNADGTMKDSITIQKELHDTFADLSESEQIAAASAIFGKAQMAPWLALINTAPEDVNTLSTSLETCAGTTEEMANAMMSGFGGSIEQLKSGIDVLVTSIGEALAPTLQKVIDFIQNLVDKFNALTPAQQQTIVTIGLVVAAIGPALVAIGSVITAVGTIMSIVPKVTNAISVLNGVLLANPILIVVAAIAALVAIFITLWNNCEGFRNFWIELWEKIKAVFSPVIEAVQNAFGKLSDKIKSDILPELQKLWEAIEKNVIPVFKLIWESVKSQIEPAFELLKTGLNNLKIAFQTAWEIIKTTVSTAFENIKVVISTAWDVIKTIVSTALDVLKNVIKTATAVINGDWKGAWEGIKNIFSSIWNGIKSVAESVWNGIKSIFQNNLNAVKSNVTTIFNGIKTTIQNTIDGAKNIVKSGLDAIKNFFSNLKLAFPKIKLPHFTITGKLSLDPPSVPHISVSWYAKAMENAMLLNGATIFGAMGGKLLGGGEAGQEVVAGANTLMNMIEKAVKNTMFGDSAITSNALSGTVRHTGTIRIEGVNNRGEFVAAGNAVVDNLGLRDIARFVMDEMQAETERKAAVY